MTRHDDPWRLFGWLGAPLLALFALATSLAALTCLFFGVSTLISGASVPSGAAALLGSAVLGLFCWLAYREAGAALGYALGEPEAAGRSPAASRI